MYVPNPSCRDFAKYEWIGQLMGAALRGKEFLVSNPVVTLSADPGLSKEGLAKPDSSVRRLFVTQVLALPGFVWKQLSGEEVSWSKDFPAVDSVLVSEPGSLFLLLRRTGPQQGVPALVPSTPTAPSDISVLITPEVLTSRS